VESATSVEGTKADNVRVAMAEPSKLVQDSPLSSDVDTQQSTIGQFLLADELIVRILLVSIYCMLMVLISRWLRNTQM